jgi:hypothetical protein
MSPPIWSRHQFWISFTEILLIRPVRASGWANVDGITFRAFLTLVRLMLFAFYCQRATAVWRGRDVAVAHGPVAGGEQLAVLLSKRRTLLYGVIVVSVNPLLRGASRACSAMEGNIRRAGPRLRNRGHASPTSTGGITPRRTPASAGGPSGYGTPPAGPPAPPAPGGGPKVTAGHDGQCSGRSSSAGTLSITAERLVVRRLAAVVAPSTVSAADANSERIWDFGQHQPAWKLS